jgi:hypothetical protein
MEPFETAVGVVGQASEWVWMELPKPPARVPALGVAAAVAGEWLQHEVAAREKRPEMEPEP